MKRSLIAASLVVVAACSSHPNHTDVADVAPTDDATAAPMPTTSAVADVTQAAGASTATAVATATPEPEPVGQAPAGSLLDRMPKRCDGGRAYIQVDKVMAGDSAASLSALIDKGLAKNKDKTHADEVFAALKAGGVDPVKQTKELAVCEARGSANDLVAVTIDLSKVKDPGGTLEKAIKAGDGDAPKKEVVGDVTYLSSLKSDDVLAIVGKSTLLFGKDRASVEAAVKGGTKGAGFADAMSFVVWADVPEAGGRGTVKESGDAFDADIVIHERGIAREKAQIEEKLAGVDKNVGKLPAGVQALVKPLLPAIKATKLSADGDDSLHVTTTFPKKTVPDVLSAMKKLGPDEIQKALRF